MRDINSGIWNRRQQLERAALAPVVGVVNGDASDAEPMFTARLCLVIKQYWRLRGVRVEAEPVRVEMGRGENGSIWGIRSLGIPVREEGYD